MTYDKGRNATQLRQSADQLQEIREKFGGLWREEDPGKYVCKHTVGPMSQGWRVTLYAPEGENETWGIYILFMTVTRSLSDVVDTAEYKGENPKTVDEALNILSRLMCDVFDEVANTLDTFQTLGNISDPKDNE